MSTIIQGNDLRTLTQGVKVDRTAAVLPATTTANIFTVSGGRVLITSLVGTVTTATTATATTLAIGTVPTVGTARTTALASAVAVTSREIGTQVNPAATLGGALVVGADAGAASQAIAAGFIVSAGAISITTSATNTGAMSWSLTYIPLDNGASVAAA
jgi:hypothetical protein